MMSRLRHPTVVMINTQEEGEDEVLTLFLCINQDAVERKRSFVLY